MNYQPAFNWESALPPSLSTLDLCCFFASLAARLIRFLLVSLQASSFVSINQYWQNILIICTSLQKYQQATIYRSETTGKMRFNPVCFSANFRQKIKVSIPMRSLLGIWPLSRMSASDESKFTANDAPFVVPSTLGTMPGMMSPADTDLFRCQVKQNLANVMRERNFNG